MADCINYLNGFIYTDGQFRFGGFTVENGIFTDVFTLHFRNDFKPVSGVKNVVDLNGAYVIPGLVDIHIHGAAGGDFSRPTKEGIETAAGFLASRGITSFLPTLMTLPDEEYIDAAHFYGEYTTKELTSHIPGIRMEGPFISTKKAGAQNPEYIRKADAALLKKIGEESGGLLRIVDLAPEEEGALELINTFAANRKERKNDGERTTDDILFSLGHTAAGYEDAMKGFDAGAGHVTHLFNAMNPFHHRAPGLIGAAWDREDVTAEIIGDGIHIHESVLRTAFRQMSGRICLISDGLSVMGQKDGEYELTGQKIELKNGAAYLKDGTLAGAYSDLYSNMLNAVSFGIPVKDAVDAATRIPAEIIGNRKIGAIETGRYADFVLCDENLKREEVYIGGKPIGNID